jgi:predicted RNA methylase
LGGGDFGYKSRFGGVERNLYNYTVKKPKASDYDSDSLLTDHIPIDLIEYISSENMEYILKNRFEEFSHFDFNSFVSIADAGTPHTSERYQPTSRDAFFDLLQKAGVKEEDVLFDIGCGKGKMLYYASLYGLKRLVGVEYSENLVAIAKKNFSRLSLASISLYHADASNLNPDILKEGTVFYLYNPFGMQVLKSFLENLKTSIVLKKRDITIIYCNSLYSEVLTKSGFQIVKNMIKDSDGWRFDTSTIYRLKADDYIDSD